MEQNNKLSTKRNNFFMSLKNMKSLNLCIADKVLSDQLTNEDLHILNLKNSDEKHINSNLNDRILTQNTRLYTCYLLLNEQNETNADHLIELQNEINSLLRNKNSRLNNQGIY